MSLPGALEALLRQAGDAWSRPEEASRLIERALKEYPDEEAAFVAAYRFYFYRNDLPRALGIAEQCLTRIQGELGLPPDWPRLAPGQIDCADPRFPPSRLPPRARHAYAPPLAGAGSNVQPSTWGEDSGRNRPPVSRSASAGSMRSRAPTPPRSSAIGWASTASGLQIVR